MIRDLDAPLTMPRPSTGAPVRIEARRHLMISSWLTMMLMVGTAVVLLARPAPEAGPTAATAKAPLQTIALR
ncbi:hypothetical protein [uncultured Alsobacter sp.]|uniref:hypothetical protein n=1 Tax=uncultured Alsobacter sp. TaxID=1748258 RepID=UPI0025E91D93|nr:hypothetical protein [uncultured Alsobacter sp.]